MQFDGRFLSNYVQVVDRDVNVGQFDLYKNTVYVDSSVPTKWIQSVALHETLEKHFRTIGLSEFSPGHLLVEDFERKMFLKSGHSKKDWHDYYSPS